MHMSKEEAKTDAMLQLHKCTVGKRMQKQRPIRATGKDHVCCTKTMQKQTATAATCQDAIDDAKTDGHWPTGKYHVYCTKPMQKQTAI